ncbi:hypothetical protein [Flexithrix dorotheae]|uniref:hypothetical protein n=1 Tax=Flexithrix dorotheae TaxID=70993 RepID=UPI00037669AB|nr:hypothetical protein [Flexithrix dorotheae]
MRKASLVQEFSEASLVSKISAKADSRTLQDFGGLRENHPFFSRWQALSLLSAEK